jgi:hypothetical protein
MIVSSETPGGLHNILQYRYLLVVHVDGVSVSELQPPMSFFGLLFIPHMI